MMHKSCLSSSQFRKVTFLPAPLMFACSLEFHHTLKIIMHILITSCEVVASAAAVLAVLGGSSGRRVCLASVWSGGAGRLCGGCWTGRGWVFRGSTSVSKQLASMQQDKYKTMHAHISTRTHIYTSGHTHLHTHLHACMYVYLQATTCKHTYIHACKYMHVCA